MLFEFPTKEEWHEKSKSYPFKEKFPFSTDDFSVEGNGPFLFIKYSLTIPWFFRIIEKLAELRTSYVWVKYYFDKGIPDDEWYISPGKNGESVQYLPHFKENRDYLIKIQYDYHADIFYSKIFSTNDIIAQYLNELCDLSFDINKVTWNRVLKEL